MKILAKTTLQTLLLMLLTKIKIRNKVRSELSKRRPLLLEQTKMKVHRLESWRSLAEAASSCVVGLTMI